METPKNVNKRFLKIGIILIFIIFALLFSLLVFPNHYFFRTNALDLGISNHALYQIAHFKIPTYSISIDGTSTHLFASHFSPIFYFYLPFYWIFGNYALLIIQLLSILFGGLGIYKILLIKVKNTRLHPIILIHFFLIWGIYSALSFDFHNTVIASMLIPWLVYYFEIGKIKYQMVFLILILFTQENMALWMIFVYLGLLVSKYLIKKEKFEGLYFIKFELSQLLFIMLYFIVVTTLIMPSLNSDNEFYQLSRYSHLGNSFGEIIENMISNPKDFFSLIFENNTGDASLNGYKTESLFMLLVSGGFLLFYRPVYLLMTLPIIAQKMFSNNYGFWGITGQYSIEFVPLLSLCLIDFIANKSKWFGYIFTLSIAFSTGYFNYKSMEKRKPDWTDNTTIAFYDKKHYTSYVDVKTVHQLLKTIPKNASLSVSSQLAPHLSNRLNIHMFPNTNNADYIVLLNDPKNSYPIPYKDFLTKVEELKKSEKYKLKISKSRLYIFKKVN